MAIELRPSCPSRRRRCPGRGDPLRHMIQAVTPAPLSSPAQSRSAPHVDLVQIAAPRSCRAAPGSTGNLWIRSPRSPRRPRVVRAGVRGADAGAGGRLAGDRARRQRPHPGADRLGQDARRLPLGDRPARRAARARGCALLYVSPLKALNYDVERNLRGPLAGLRSELRVAVRTGDTPQKERREMRQAPAGHPDHDARVALPAAHLAGARSSARVETVIVDEVHAVAGTKRGAHLALSLERLDALARQPVPAHRPVGDAAARSRRSAASSPAAARSSSSTRARARSSTSRSSSRSRTCASSARRASSSNRRCAGRRRRWTPATRRPRARSGRRSTRSCSSSCARTARRSCSSTTAASPSGWRCG